MREVNMGRLQPHGVTAVLDNGIRVPCAVLFDGADDEGYPKYRIVAEIDWKRFQITRVEVRYWPNNTSLALDMPDASEAQSREYASRIIWVDKGN